MVKTIKEMQDKAMHLQGDYLKAYEDMQEVLKEAYRQAEEVAPGVYPEDMQEFLVLFLRFLGLDNPTQ